MAKQTKLNDFEAVFNQYKGWVYKTAYLILEDHHKAEDVVQDVFISAYKSNGNYDSEKGSYTSWLRRITINRCLNDSRRWDFSLSSIEEIEDKGYNIPDSGIPLSEKVALSDYTQRLIGSLSAKYRAALVLRCMDGLTYNEIAEVLGIPLGTVKSRINGAILAVRDRQKKMDKGGPKP